MDPHEIHLGGDRKVEELLPVGFSFLRPLDFRNAGGVRTQHLARGQARQSQHARDQFHCKVFLTGALRYMGGAPERGTIDYTHVAVLRGTGRDMIPCPKRWLLENAWDSASWRTRSATPTARRS